MILLKLKYSMFKLRCADIIVVILGSICVVGVCIVYLTSGIQVLPNENRGYMKYEI